MNNPSYVPFGSSKKPTALFRFKATRLDGIEAQTSSDAQVADILSPASLVVVFW